MTPPSRPSDLRLAGLAVALWLAALASLHLSTVAAVWLAVSAVLFAAALTVFLHSSARWARRPLVATYGWIAVAVLLGVLCGAGATAARLSVRDATEIRDLAERRAVVTATLVVRDDPRPVRGGAGRPQSLLIPTGLVRFGEADRPDVTARARVLVLADGPAWRELLPGQRLTVRGRLAVPRGGDLTAAVLSATGSPQLIGRPSWAQRAAGALRDGLQRACAPLADEPGGLLPGLVVGDTSRLLPTVEEDFRATGLTHLVAVSGSNVAIVVGFVLLLARWSRLGPGLAAAACAVALVGFVILARPSPSVIRAATMGAIGLAALAAGRPRAALPALCTAVAVLVVADPALAGDPGFALSVLATAGLLLLAPGWRDALRRRGVPPGLAEALAIPASAQVACAPVVAGLSGTVSLVAVPANLLAVPAIAPATVLGVAAAVVSPVWLPGAEFAAWLAGWPAWWLVVVARVGAQLPAGTVPWLDGIGGALLLATLTIALLIGARHPTVRRLVLVTGVAIAVGVLPVRFAASGWPPKGWLVVACAVGQGDAIVLPAAPGRAVVIDAGPEPAPVDRCLRRLGVREVSVLVVSHLHADHVGGLAGVFRGRRVSGVVAPDFAEPAAGRDSLLAAAAAAAAPVRLASAGWTYRDGQLELLALGPTSALRG
ncbi:MAG TPA: ComEC/Rec2 family competence protein, partial [Micromonosporaceae bacterium]|nr:ComEC/Rec2 family competence protein [Micromonosporaceae bacterium]